jgi:hypothetical protein
VADARVAEAKRLTGGLRRDRRQHPHRGRGEYSGRAREVAGAIADMIESGGAADAVPLARRAVERVTAAMLHMDDSSGIIERAALVPRSSSDCDSRGGLPVRQ